MVIAFIGKNGCGKTITMVREADSYGAVFCNFHFLPGPYQKVLYDVQTDDLFEKLRYYIAQRPVDPVTGGFVKPQRITLAIDEGGLVFPARSWKKLSLHEAALFAQSRKLGIDFLYTAQSPKMVDSILRMNTALAGYPSHFFRWGWCRYYEGIEQKKDMLQYITSYWMPAYYRRYKTLEVVASTKFYFDAEDDKKTPDLAFSYGSRMRQALPAMAVEPERDLSSGNERASATDQALEKEEVA